MLPPNKTAAALMSVPVILIDIVPIIQSVGQGTVAMGMQPASLNLVAVRVGCLQKRTRHGSPMLTFRRI